MYLSQVMLTQRDSYEQHQAIWSLFAHMPDRKRDHLFRVEQSNKHRNLVLLQSSTQPVSSDQAEVVASKSFSPKVQLNACYKFKLLACPTKRVNKTRKLIEIHNPDEQVQWLQNKLRGANVTVTSMDNFLVSHKKAFNSRFVCFEGVLQVTEPSQIETALVMGVGRKKTCRRRAVITSSHCITGTLYV